MTPSTTSQMPYGKAAAAINAPLPLPPLNIPPGGPGPALPMPPTSAPAAGAAPSSGSTPGFPNLPPGSPMGAQPMFPPPSAPAAPPWSTVQQGDGSSVVTIPGPDGNPVVIAVNPAPKLPKALQATQQPKQ